MKDSEFPAFAIGIPTRNRPLYLEQTLTSITRLAQLPREIFVCDSSDLELQDVLAVVCNNSQIKTTLLKSVKASIPFQRNAIAQAFLDADTQFDFLLFLDDDTEPAIDYSQRLVDFLLDNPQYGGASGVTQTEHRHKALDLIGLAFLVNGEQGHVLRSGVGIPPSRDCDSDVEWIFGCSVWRRDVIETFAWNGNWDGYAVGEDVEFSYRVSKMWKLRVLAGAKIVNAYAPEGRPTSYVLARSTVVHRWHIAQLHNKPLFISRLCVIWSCLGELGFTCIKILTKPSKDRFRSLFGFISGLINIF